MLGSDQSFRIATPQLFSVEEALKVVGLRSCKNCWPNLEQSDSPPMRELFAENLKPVHIGRTLANEGGVPQSVIREINIHRSTSPVGRFAEVLSVDLRTDAGTTVLEPRQRVHVIMELDQTLVAERKATIRGNLGFTETELIVGL
jgi:hypothetical protein